MSALPNYSVLFSPKGGCTQAIVDHITAAKVSIYVMAYEFTSKPIANALAQAVQRNIPVSIIMDKLESAYSELPLFTANHVPTWLDGMHPIFHDKVMIIDHNTVLTGSFNYTMHAETYNAENLLIISDAQLAALYEANWNAHVAHSVKAV